MHHLSALVGLVGDCLLLSVRGVGIAFCRPSTRVLCRSRTSPLLGAAGWQLGPDPMLRPMHWGQPSVEVTTDRLALVLLAAGFGKFICSTVQSSVHVTVQCDVVHGGCSSVLLPLPPEVQLQSPEAWAGLSRTWFANVIVRNQYST